MLIFYDNRLLPEDEVRRRLAATGLESWAIDAFIETADFADQSWSEKLAEEKGCDWARMAPSIPMALTRASMSIT
jgi:hypothetical protein